MQAAEHDTPHEGHIDLEDPGAAGLPAGIGLLTAKFVHYPGSQQLQLWLPPGGPGGYTAWRRVAADGLVAEQGPVDGMPGGAVKLLLDTLAWPPGEWRLEVEHADGWHHTLALRKRPAGEPAAAGEPGLPPEPGHGGRLDTAAAVYRDGAGRAMPDDERAIREQALARLAGRFARQVRYEGYGRAGTYTWTDGPRRLRFDQEMGAGPCRAVVMVPCPARWEAETGLPLSRRDEIVQRVAAQACSDFGSRVEIGEDSINVY